MIRDFIDSLIKTSSDESVFDGKEIQQLRNDDNLDLLVADMVIAGTSSIFILSRGREWKI